MGKVKVHYPVDYKLIGSRIQEARRNRGMTQQDIAERMDLSVEYISRIERGHVKFNLIMLYLIADILDEAPEHLISGTSVLAKNYLEAEFAEILSHCTPKKMDVIYRFAKDISEL